MTHGTMTTTKGVREQTTATMIVAALSSCILWSRPMAREQRGSERKKNETGREREGERTGKGREEGEGRKEDEGTQSITGTSKGE